MGSITIVNLTDSPIQSAIANAGNIHSGINGILPHVYYHHNATSGTGYEVWERWYIPGIVEDFPSSDLEKIGWYIGSAFITALGIVGTVLSAGTLGPALAAYTAANAALPAALTAGLTSAAAATATAAVVEAFNVVLLTATGTAIGGFVGVTGLGVTIGGPVADYVASLKKCTVGTVWGQENRILSFTGKIPLNARVEQNADGKGTAVVEIPKDKTAETAPPPKYEKDLTPEAFDMMRRKGEIYQIKHRNGEYCDMTQGLVRLNLKGGGGLPKFVKHGGAAIDISKIYKIYLRDSNDSATTSCLMAGEDEGDNRVYLRKKEEGQELSCCYWQFIPTKKEEGVDEKDGWILVDRRYGRFLYWSGSEILQYQSEEVGATKFCITDGWAKHIELKGMVWNLSFDSTIEQPGMERICVTGRTDQGRAIYARPYGSHDVWQKWYIAAED